ncbi:hypothetical protein XENORESO_001210 [Xenotaenia resolanae]|uniref:Uncharacterized protein n=1 Tax=Xenotaenia resolanae TaxID=208358 RepID=A0ABV0WHM7_9TELE
MAHSLSDHSHHSTPPFLFLSFTHSKTHTLTHAAAWFHCAVIFLILHFPTVMKYFLSSDSSLCGCCLSSDSPDFTPNTFVFNYQCISVLRLNQIDFYRQKQLRLSV